MQIFHHLRTFALMAIILWACISSSLAGTVSVSAELSQPQVNAGEMVELQVKVTGVESADVPRDIPVEGLQIRLTGQSTQVQMVNFKVSSSSVYSYVVIPLQTGNFTIPSISVKTASGILQTRPLSFSVIDSGASPSVGNTAPQLGMPRFQSPHAATQHTTQPDMNHLAFGEISCPKKSLYVGEMMPVEIRFYFDAHYPVQVQGRVDFGSEGVLVERFPDPKQSRIERDGQSYNVLSFRTLVSAVKPGEIDIPPAKLPSEIKIQGGDPGDELSSQQQLIQQLMSGQSPFVQTHDVTVTTQPLHLEILPLPKKGRPASFGGAVGQFDIDSTVPNLKSLPGDPVTLTIKIGGKGNFHSMGAPMLTHVDGWRTYPPAEKFDESDTFSYSGVKSFDFTMIAQQPMTNSPGSEFSYFDPVDAKYVTLTTQPLPLSATPSASAVLPMAASPQSQRASTAIVKSDEDQISTSSLRSWKTPMERSEFLLATLAMIVATAAFAGILHFRNVQTSRESLGTRRRRLTELWSSLNTDSLDAADSYEAALQYLELLTASETESLREEITKHRDLLKYGVGGSVALHREERNQLIEKLKKLSSQKF